MKYKPLPLEVPAAPTVEELGLDQPVSFKYGRADVMVDPQWGLERIRAIAGGMNPERIEAQRRVMALRPYQSVTILGGSAGYGLELAVSLLEAGHRNLVVVYNEPDVLLLRITKNQKAAVRARAQDDNAPAPTDPSVITSKLMPLWERLSDVQGLRLFAAEKGAHLKVAFANAVLADTQNGNQPFSPEIVTAVEESLKLNPWFNNSNAIAVNSIAFAPNIVPNWGVPTQRGYADIDPATGQVVINDQHVYAPEKWQADVDAMGNNPGHLMELMQQRGWLGPQSVSIVFSWRGGSRDTFDDSNAYATSSLRPSKIAAEEAAARLDMASKANNWQSGRFITALLPIGKTKALGKIPRGAAMGILSEAVLGQHGIYRSISDTVVEIFPRVFGRGFASDNTIAPLEFDLGEALHFPEIVRRINTLQARANEAAIEQRRLNSAWDGRFDLETSVRLYEGLVDPGFYGSMLLRLGFEAG
jgi:NAD(P)-dependent dehydrogenase (short-subunit alcohol dehydrogenase family)